MTEQPSLAGANKIARDKYWEERTAEEKIEILRTELALACRTVQRLQTSVNALMRHEHATQGHIMLPLEQTVAAESGGGLYASDYGIPRSLRTERERR